MARSCTAAAAYRSASRISSRSRLGRSERISSSVIPSASIATTVATGMRSPRMQGSPSIWLGFTVIRVYFMEVIIARTACLRKFGYWFETSNWPFHVFGFSRDQSRETDIGPALRIAGQDNTLSGRRSALGGYCVSRPFKRLCARTKTGSCRDPAVCHSSLQVSNRRIFAAKAQCVKGLIARLSVLHHVQYITNLAEADNDASDFRRHHPILNGPRRKS